jgi:hypothetical protein
LDDPFEKEQMHSVQIPTGDPTALCLSTNSAEKELHVQESNNKETIKKQKRYNNGNENFFEDGCLLGCNAA